MLALVDIQYMMPDFWDLMLRGAAETAVMALAAVWFVAHLRQGFWAVVGACGAGCYAVLYGVFTVGNVRARQDSLQPDWLTWLYGHSSATEWLRIAGLGVAVVAFMLAYRSHQRVE